MYSILPSSPTCWPSGSPTRGKLERSGSEAGGEWLNDLNSVEPLPSSDVCMTNFSPIHRSPLLRDRGRTTLVTRPAPMQQIDISGGQAAKLVSRSDRGRISD